MHDWRLRECNYGHCNGMPSADLDKNKRRYLDQPYPGGESWRGAITRAGGFLDDLRSYWPDQRVLVIGHVATRWAFDALINGVALDDQIDVPFVWSRGLGVPVRVTSGKSRRSHRYLLCSVIGAALRPT